MRLHVNNKLDCRGEPYVQVGWTRGSPRWGSSWVWCCSLSLGRFLGADMDHANTARRSNQEPSITLGKTPAIDHWEFLRVGGREHASRYTNVFFLMFYNCKVSRVNTNILESLNLSNSFSILSRQVLEWTVDVMQWSLVQMSGDGCVPNHTTMLTLKQMWLLRQCRTSKLLLEVKWTLIVLWVLCGLGHSLLPCLIGLQTMMLVMLL